VLVMDEHSHPIQRQHNIWGRLAHPGARVTCRHRRDAGFMRGVKDPRT
jgi:hypothetical protein